LTGLLTWTPNLHEAGTYSGIVVSASDGYLTATQTISITVTVVNQPPVFIPLQPQSGREVTQLQFALAATDPNGGTLTYRALAPLPPGVTLDPTSGKVQWTPAYGQAGDYTLQFGVTDSAGLSATLPVDIHIDPTYRAPTLQASNHQVVVGQPFSMHLVAADFDEGTTLTYSAFGMPEGASLDPGTGVFRWTPGPTQAGDFVVQFTVSDGELSTTLPVLLRSVINPVPPQVIVVVTPSFPEAPGYPVLVHVAASSVAPITGLTLAIAGQPVALDSQGRATYVPSAPGRFAVTATATDGDGYTGQYSTVLKVRDPNDVGAPVVSLSPSLHNAVLTQPTSIVGAVSDSNLDSWTLELAPLGSNQLTQLAAGNASVSRGTLAQLNPSTLANGPYQLVLTAANISGKVTTVTDTIEVDTPTKPTQYLTNATDLTVQLGGVTVSLVRQYDSLTAGQSGTFGYGWRLANTDFDIQTTVAPTGLEAEGVYNPFSIGTRLYLTLPDGSRVGFTFAPVEHQQSGLVYYTPAWQADPGVAYTLSSAPALLSAAVDRLYDLRTGQPYNPASGDFGPVQYTLTAPDGTVYYLSTQKGLREEVLPGGTTLTFSGSGIVSSTGQALTFVHDAQGRLTKVIAPDGTQVLYSYDAGGNLISARNLTLGQSDRYGYSQTTPHLLDLVVSPQAGASTVIDYGPGPVVVPLRADLGGSGQFLTNTEAGSLAAGATDNYSFGFRASEIHSTNSGSVYLGVEVQAAPGSNLQPAVPMIAGLTPVVSSTGTGSAFALFEITREGLELLSISGGNAATTGGYTLHLFVAGDVNRDGTVDATDGQLLAAAMGSSLGQPNYHGRRRLHPERHHQRDRRPAPGQRPRLRGEPAAGGQRRPGHDAPGPRRQRRFEQLGHRRGGQPAILPDREHAGRDSHAESRRTHGHVRAGGGVHRSGELPVPGGRRLRHLAGGPGGRDDQRGAASRIGLHAASTGPIPGRLATDVGDRGFRRSARGAAARELPHVPNDGPDGGDRDVHRPDQRGRPGQHRTDHFQSRHPGGHRAER
jgi:YD repeat-containing protein